MTPSASSDSSSPAPTLALLACTFSALTEEGFSADCLSCGNSSASAAADCDFVASFSADPDCFEISLAVLDFFFLTGASTPDSKTLQRYLGIPSLEYHGRSSHLHKNTKVNHKVKTTKNNHNQNRNHDYRENKALHLCYRYILVLYM